MRWVADGDARAGADHVNFSLRGRGELLRLYGSRRNPIDEVEIVNQADGISRGRLPDGASAYADFPDTPTPGANNYLPLLDVVINEVLAHTDAPLEDAIEIRNISDTEINVGGWLLGDTPSGATRFEIPADTKIALGGFAVFYEGSFNAGGTGFSLNSAHGDTVYLTATDADGNPTGYRVAQPVPPTANGVSVGRVPTSQGWKFATLLRRTFGSDMPVTVEQFRTGEGAGNSSALVGPVVISEIQYESAPDVAGLGQAQLEYIELRNISNRTVPLYHPQEQHNRWRLAGGVNMTLPGELTLRADGYLLLVGFDPVAEPAIASRFIENYDVPDDVPLVGPFGGRLSNGGETVSLLRPDNTQGIDQEDAGYVPYIPVESIGYDNSEPWPDDADGTNSRFNASPDQIQGRPEKLALCRTDRRSQNADAAAGDRDTDGMSDAWEVANKLDPANAADAESDADNDGVNNLGEFLSGTDPNDANDRFIIESISVTDDRVAITVYVSPDRRYRVETFDTVAGGWERLAEFTTDAGQTSAKFESNAALGQARFYRVVLVE